MISALVELSLRFRYLVITISLAFLTLGTFVASQLTLDVLPNLSRPRVVVITECPGMAPEEVELRVTIPLENALNGATDVLDVRTTSDIGLSVIQVEFDWGQDLYRARQIVQERLVSALDRLPERVQPQLAPMASLLGQIMLVGMWSEDGTTDLMELRTQADWVVGQRLRSIRGVTQVIAMGGARKQFQILVDFHSMHRYEVTLADIEQALLNSNLSVAGGYIQDGSEELLIRGLGLISDVDTMKKIVVRSSSRRPVLLEQVADVVEGPQFKRGDSSVNGRPAVVLTIQKQPDADTRELTEQILVALDELRSSLPPDVVLRPTYEQREFIDLGVANVISALQSGSVLVVIVLFVFLMNVRTTLITLLAIPMSLAITALVFWRWGLGINVMTLGGLAVGLGMLVDDAIVGVENIYQRLRSRAMDSTASPYAIVLQATQEVLQAIVVSTLIVVVVFGPLFMLSGMEGRLFTPLAIAYLVSIVASTLVALTLTPALSLVLLPSSGGIKKMTGDGILLKYAKKIAAPWIRFSLNPVGFLCVAVVGVLSVVIAIQTVQTLPRDFLPEFDEGATQVNLYTTPGTSLETMVSVSQRADARFKALQMSPENPMLPIADFTCKIGRAEMDEHIMGVNVAEYVITLNPNTNKTRREVIDALTEAVDDFPGVEHEIEQPIAHLISHMLSGVAAQIAIKIHGDDLEVLKRKADEIRRTIETVPGIADPFVEQQQWVPQLRFEIDYEALARYGLTARQLTDMIETAMHGRTVTQVTDGQRFFDVVLRMQDEYRLDIDNLERLHLELNDGARIQLGSLVHIQRGGGPNTINRENARRRIVVRVNTTGGDLSGVVQEIRQRISESVSMPEGYYITYGGQFEARQSAQRNLFTFSICSTLIVIAILYSIFPEVRVVLQVLVAVPAAFVGGVMALAWTGQSLSVAALVGFVSLGGIATRNGLLLISTYRNLKTSSGMTHALILQGSLERLSPVLISALTTALGLVPLVIGGTQPGKEILFPVATVIVGGLLTSTLCELLVRPGLYWFMLPFDGRRSDHPA
ncbi:efflux RND transporter permease subunit [Pirellulaceae bacterium SH449]